MLNQHLQAAPLEHAPLVGCQGQPKRSCHFERRPRRSGVFEVSWCLRVAPKSTPPPTPQPHPLTSGGGPILDIPAIVASGPCIQMSRNSEPPKVFNLGRLQVKGCPGQQEATHAPKQWLIARFCIMPQNLLALHGWIALGSSRSDAQKHTSAQIHLGEPHFGSQVNLQWAPKKERSKHCFPLNQPNKNGLNQKATDASKSAPPPRCPT